MKQKGEDIVKRDNKRSIFKLRKVTRSDIVKSHCDIAKLLINLSIRIIYIMDVKITQMCDLSCYFCEKNKAAAYILSFFKEEHNFLLRVFHVSNPR